MTTAPPQQSNLDRFVVIHVATTCDEHGVYVTKDSAEVIELGWILLDAKNCEELYRESVLVKPINTPITPLCSMLHNLRIHIEILSSKTLERNQFTTERY